MKFQICSLAAAVALAFAGLAQAQSSPRAAPAAPRADRPAMDHKMKKAEEERIEAAYKADKAKCDAMKGNEKDVCQKEAKGKEKVAKAELDARASPSEHNQRKVLQAKADAQYDVAKEKCDGMKGNEKDACQKDAKAEHERAQAELKRSASTGSSSKASAASTHTTGTSKAK